jgi:peptidoglycan-associated lipoprotein
MKVSVSVLILLCTIALNACSRPPKVGKKIIDPVPEQQQADINNGHIDQGLQSGEPDSADVDDKFAYLVPVFFDYDKAEIRSDQIEVLQSNAQYLRNLSAQRVQIQGHCDERGTEEYNLALGDRRARAVKDYLSSLGISNERLTTISFGEALPFETEHDETAWSKNRRAHFQERNRP